AVRDHCEAAEAEQVRAAVGVGAEPAAEAARGGPDQQPPDPPAGRRGDLLPQRVAQVSDRPPEQLPRAVPWEAGRDDAARAAAQEVTALGVAGEVQVARRKEPVRFERELVALLRFLADREEADLWIADVEDLLRENRAHMREL